MSRQRTTRRVNVVLTRLFLVCSKFKNALQILCNVLRSGKIAKHLLQNKVLASSGSNLKSAKLQTLQEVIHCLTGTPFICKFLNYPIDSCSQDYMMCGVYIPSIISAFHSSMYGSFVRNEAATNSSLEDILILEGRRKR